MSILERLDGDLAKTSSNLTVVSKQIADLLELEKNLKTLSERIKESGTNFDTIDKLLRGSSTDFHNVLAFLNDVVTVLNRSDPQKILATMDKIAGHIKLIRENVDTLERSYQDISRNSYDIQLHTGQLESHLDSIQESQVDIRKTMEDIGKRIATIKYSMDENLEQQGVAISKSIARSGKRLWLIMAGLFVANWVITGLLIFALTRH